jgi:single-strand DNA-binding protein
MGGPSEDGGSGGGYAPRQAAPARPAAAPASRPAAAALPAASNFDDMDDDIPF